MANKTVHVVSHVESRFDYICTDKRTDINIYTHIYIYVEWKQKRDLVVRTDTGSNKSKVYDIHVKIS